MTTEQFLFFQTLINAILAGSLFGMIALGLTLVWGILRIANFAHLSFVLLSAYIAYELMVSFGWYPLLPIIIVVPVMFLIGVAAQWLFMHFKVTTFTSLLLTFGIFIVLENVITYIWTADTVSARREIPQAFTRGIRLPVDRLQVFPPDLIAFIAAVTLGGAIVYLLRYSRWGRAVRAMAEDPVMAQAYGVNYQQSALLLSGLAAATAGVAGVILAISESLFPSMALSWIGKVVAAVILGGMGNPIGAIVAAISLTTVEELWRLYAQPSLAPLISFTILIGVLVIQPGSFLRRYREQRSIQSALAKSKIQ